MNNLQAKQVRVLRIFLVTIDGIQTGSRASGVNDVERWVIAHSI